MCWVKLLSQAVGCSKHTSRNRIPPLRKPYSSNSATSTLSNLPFFPSLSVSLLHIPSPPVLMPVKPDKRTGPRRLEAVKLRLRAEQVARENAAALRYRQLAEELDEQPLRRRHATDRDTGKTSWLECFLCALVVCCVFLVVAVVFLCVVVLSLSKKE
jgi:hypothetical protein